MIRKVITLKIPSLALKTGHTLNKCVHMLRDDHILYDHEDGVDWYLIMNLILLKIFPHIHFGQYKKKEMEQSKDASIDKI